MSPQINLFIVNSSSGYTGNKSFASGVTLGDVFDMEVRNGNRNNYAVRLNRVETRNYDQPLRDGDRVSITPSKVDAGRA